jgi:hypothetical protein
LKRAVAVAHVQPKIVGESIGDNEIHFAVAVEIAGRERMQGNAVLPDCA